MSPLSRCGGHPFESPGRGSGRRGAGGSGRERPGPLPAPHQVEELGPQFPQFLYLVQLRGSVSKFPPTSPATASVLSEHPATLAAQLRGCLVSKSGSPAELASPTWTPVSHGKAGRARPCLSPGCYSSATLPGQARQRCVGHPECGPEGPLAQHVSVSIPQGAPCRLSHPAPVEPSVQGLRPSAITFVGALSRAVPARGREAVCPPHKLSVFVGVWEPEVSQPLCRQSPPAPTRQTASRPNPPLRSGASMV